MVRLRLGTCASEVDLPSAKQVAQTLQVLFDGLEVEVVPVGTAGEGRAARERDAALLGGAIDCSLHRGQDFPARLSDGLCVAAFCKREDPREVFVTLNGLSWEGFGAGRVAVSSLCRRLQVKRVRPAVEPVNLEGTVSARLGRLKEGFCDALILPSADWICLDLPPKGAEVIPVEDLVPPPGQGALVLQTRLDRRDVREMLQGLDDPLCRLEMEFERSLLQALGPEQSQVLGALARSAEDGISMSVFHSSPDGTKPIRLRRFCAGPSEKEGFIAELARIIQRSH